MDSIEGKIQSCEKWGNKGKSIREGGAKNSGKPQNHDLVPADIGD